MLKQHACSPSAGELPSLSTFEHVYVALSDLVALIAQQYPWLEVVDAVLFPRPSVLVKDRSNLGIHVAFHDKDALALYMDVVGMGGICQKGSEAHG
jgi:hypothetical protein